jgi:hypothetical protein
MHTERGQLNATINSNLPASFLRFSFPYWAVTCHLFLMELQASWLANM